MTQTRRIFLSNSETSNQYKTSENRKQGTNQTGMRAFNERLILSLLREHASLAKSDIAKMTKLTAQTVSVIMRKLESEGLLLKGDPIRGKVGKPLIPMKLNPEGAFFLGLKVGRRSSQLVLIDLLGDVKKSREINYKYPSPNLIVEFALNNITAIKRELSTEKCDRILGLGLAIPYQLWNWCDETGAPRDAMNSWKENNIQEIFEYELPYPIYQQNDATAACGAELAFGNTHGSNDFIYIHVGAFIGGGIVLNGRLFTGTTGNAGAIGSMPVSHGENNLKQLINIASITSLEKKLLENNQSTVWLWENPNQWNNDAPEINEWIKEAGHSIAYAIITSCSVINFESAIIDGWLPRHVLKKLIKEVKREIQQMDLDGLQAPEVYRGVVGINSKSIGAASLPLSDKFMLG